MSSPALGGMEAGACSCDYGDYDSPAFYTVSIRRAAKSHRCCECKQEIPVGEQYEYFAGKWDEFETYKTCLVCSRIRADFCAPFTMLRAVIWDGLGCDYLGEWEEPDDE